MASATSSPTDHPPRVSRFWREVANLCAAITIGMGVFGMMGVARGDLHPAALPLATAFMVTGGGFLVMSYLWHKLDAEVTALKGECNWLQRRSVLKQVSQVDAIEKGLHYIRWDDPKRAWEIYLYGSTDKNIMVLLDSYPYGIPHGACFLLEDGR